jgi:hypothetical protein
MVSDTLINNEKVADEQYDGYETFSMAPPPAAASFGVDSSMDPPQDGDEDMNMNVMGGMAERLGLGEGGVVRPGAQAELMEQLGLGEGTRVVDLQVSFFTTSL